MKWCNAYGVAKNPAKFGDDIVLDLTVCDEDNDMEINECVGAIRLDKEQVEQLINTLRYYIGE